MKDLIERLKPLVTILEQEIKNNFSCDSFLQQIASDYNYILPDYSKESLPAILAQSSIYHLLCLKTISDRQIEEQIEILECENFLDFLVKELYNKTLLTDILNILNEVDFRDILRQSFSSYETEVLLLEILKLSLGQNDRKQLGYYYTPNFIPSFITRLVDKILKDNFEELSDGLASVNDKNKKPLVKILDPATGTGTFLSCAIDNIEQTIKSSGKDWNDYVSNYLLPSINGFEIYLPSYAFARLNIVIKLFKSGYDFSTKQINILLSDALSNTENISSTESPFAKDLKKADCVKNDKNVNVIICNPPYSSFSIGSPLRYSGKTYEALIKSSKFTNIKPLLDTYVQFLYFSQSHIELSGHGVIGVITNNSYLSSPMFTRMRESWLRFFSEIYILDLHGNERIREKSPTGDKDENIFGITAGLSIALLIKTRKPSSNKLARTYFYDLWGTKSDKVLFLENEKIDTIKWKELKPFEPSFYFNLLSEPLNIDLKDNGLHSLKKGIDSYQEFKSTCDYWLLKDSIISLHHGIELLMKEILFKENQYLILSDLKDIASKQKKAKQEGKDIFDLENSLNTVSFIEAIARVQVFIKSNCFDNDLYKYLTELNSLRNRITHYKVSLDGQTVGQLIEAIREPLDKFLREQGIEADFLRNNLTE